jgi:peptidoglycan/xylan/chitin deacetylase (PgdA/CDA1 family)
MASATGGFTYSHGGIIRGDSTKKNIALVFTGHEFAEGGNSIAQTLRQENAKASFFFTGNFYRDLQHEPIIGQLKKDKHYLGAHSDEHLLYCDWNNREKLLVTKDKFNADLQNNFGQMKMFGVEKMEASWFLPPYEWYNDSISAWTKELGLQLVNFTPGTLSHTDYTTAKDKNYRSSETIYNSIISHESSKSSGLNGFILLMHIGAGPDRTDKFYTRLPGLINYLKKKGYQFKTIDKLLSQ